MIHKQRLNNRILSLVLALVMVLTSLTVFPLTASAANASSYDISSASVTIDDSCGNNCAGHTITGTTTSNTVTVSGGTHNITITNLNINVTTAADYTSAFAISSGASVNLTLNGTNVLKSGERAAGLQVPSGATLVITKESSGGIEAVGGTSGAGIGGCFWGSGGTIIINGGTVTASAGKYGAGIGGGNFGTSGTITIDGGTVTAKGGNNGAGIGSGQESSGGGVITINGGTVTAQGGRYSAGIGGGGGYSSGGTIVINGGMVTATGGINGAGIGDGKSSGAKGSFSTGDNGNAVIVASSISTTTNQDSWNGIINYTLYGTSVTPTENFEISAGKTLTIANGQILTVAEGITLTNNGTIDLEAGGQLIVDGTLINNGAIIYNGTITENGTLGGAGFNIYVKTLDGEHILFNVSSADTISELKNRIFNAKAIPVSKQVLIFASTELEDDKTFGDYNNIQKDSTIHLKVKPTVTFDKNGGTGNMDSVVVTEGESYTLPANGFTAPAGKQFKAWSVGDREYAAGDKITVSADTTVTAVWENIPAEAPTVTAGDDLTITYNGYTDEQISVSVTEQTDYTYSYQWYADDGQLIDGAINSTYTVPNDLAADSYSYYCRVTAKRIDNELTAFTDSDRITVTVNKATPGVTAPTAKEDLVYNGSEQELISAGSTTNGTMQYALGTAEAMTGEWKTDIPKATKAGTYYVWYKVVGNENYNDVAPAHITVTINKATPGVTAPTAKENLVYNGSEQALIDAGSATNGTMQYALGTSNTTVPTGGWSIDIPEARNADTYYVWYKVVGNENYNDINPVCITVTVAKAKITVTAEDKSKTYGSADPALTWSITSGALAPNDSLTGISLSRATGEDADRYAITVSQTAGSNPNYDITLVNGTFTIAQKEINVSWSNMEFTYDGTAKKPTVTTADFVANDNVALTVSGEQTNAGVDYTATVTITGAKAGNYRFADGAATTTKFTIKKADQDRPAAIESFNETISGKRDGYFTGVDTTMEYRKDDETGYNPITGDKVENLAAGKYFVRVMGKENYNPSPDTEITIAAGRKLAVTVPQNQIGYTLTVDKNALDWQGQVTITFALADGYSKSGTDFAVKVNGTAITLDENDKYIVTGAETDLTITVAGVVDETAPEAKISITTNKWAEFLNDITFGLFFKETQNVTITATDKGSGVDEIYYYISEDVLTEDEVEALAADKWTPYDADNNPSIDPDKKCVVYVKATDKAQNVKFISSTGLVFDGTAPALFGIENGGIYYGDKIFKATDDNFLKIEVDGIDVTDTTQGDDEYKIVADNAEHTVTVTDKAGNKTEYKVTVYKNYTVTYKVDGETVSTQTVGYGKDATPPAIPEKEGYTQTSPTWDNDGKNITADTVINAVYTINSYTITLDYPTYDREIVVNHGMSFNAMYPDIDANVNLAAEKDYHTFIGWYESTDGGVTLKDTPYDFNTKVTGDITLYPMFKIYTYTVTYKADGKVVGTVEVEHGADAMAPAIPEKEGYTQTAPVWDKDGKNITADTEINAVYTINEYTVTFMSEDGVYKTVTVKHGEKVTMPEAPTKDGYTVKWEKVLDTVTEDTTVKAVYTEIPATDKPSSPQTGDNSKLWLYWLLLIVSAACIVVICINRKRKHTQAR